MDRSYIIGMDIFIAICLILNGLIYYSAFISDYIPSWAIALMWIAVLIIIFLANFINYWYT